jgi:hypothetical protein
MGHFIIYLSQASSVAALALTVAVIDGLAFGRIMEPKLWQFTARWCLFLGVMQAACVLCVEHQRSEVLRGQLAAVRGVPLSAIKIAESDRPDIEIKHGAITVQYRRPSGKQPIDWRSQ